MRILTRHVTFELIKVFALTLLAILALLIVVIIGRSAVRQGVGPGPLLRMIPYVLPEAMRFAVPGTILLAATNVYGRMSAANEVVALKSLGVSPMCVLWPVLALSSMVSLATVWVNDLAVSWGRTGVRRVLLDSAEQIAYGMLKTHGTYSTPSLTLTVRELRQRKLIEPTLIVKATKQTPWKTVITADHAELKSDPEAGTSTIVFHNAVIKAGPNRLVMKGSHPFNLPLPDFVRDGHGAGRPSECPLGRITQRIHEQKKRILRKEEQLAARAAFGMMTGDFERLFEKQWSRDQTQLEELRGTLFRLRTEPHRRWANGFSCLCFCMIGAPMAIRRRHGEFLATFFACFFPILLVYYPFLIYSVDAAKEGTLPPYSVWAGNVALVAWGGWQMRKVQRY